MAIDDAELLDAEAFVESQDVDLADDFASLDLDGITQPEPGELDLPEFRGDAEPLPLDDANDGAAEQMPVEEPEAEVLPEVEADLQPEPEAQPAPMPEPEPEIEAMPEPEFEPEFDISDVGGFDDGGFDDLDGDFEFGLD